jgi:hypothetical protein
MEWFGILLILLPVYFLAAINSKLTKIIDMLEAKARWSSERG